MPQKPTTIRHLYELCSRVAALLLANRTMRDAARRSTLVVSRARHVVRVCLRRAGLGFERSMLVLGSTSLADFARYSNVDLFRCNAPRLVPIAIGSEARRSPIFD